MHAADFWPQLTRLQARQVHGFDTQSTASQFAALALYTLAEEQRSASCLDHEDEVFVDSTVAKVGSSEGRSPESVEEVVTRVFE